ncbi:targeting protein for Xklp2-like isoform X2 [Periplaneta americana]|uniref:targeting protein for Xklp2-like isoform X2 n=1 Tax=Periplaneta americana TaxID=6978 RepID=UPI0037E86AB9
MDDFEVDAPMYVNFEDSAALEQNDGGDKFFDCVTESVNSSRNFEHDNGSAVSVSTPTDLESVSTISGEEESMEELSQNIHMIDQAMKSLLTATKAKKSHVSRGSSSAQSRPKGKLLFSKEDIHKRKASSPIAQYAQPCKFISMAEAVRRFHANTPDRFHTKPKFGKFNTSLQNKGSVIIKNTIPQAPHLTSHLRSRPVHYLTREEEEEKEAEEMKAFQIKANPLNSKVLEPPKLGKRIERKPPTVPVPFNLTEVAKKKAVVPPVYTFTANPAPTSILQSTQGVPKKKEIPLTHPVSPTCLKKSKVYAISLEVKDGVKSVTEKEVHHFGIPTASNHERKRFTEVHPFSFEERDKQLLKKKEEHIKKVLEEEKKTREFHARPLPSCIKSPSSQKHVSLVATQPSPFKLEVDKRGMTKQQQLKMKLEEEARELQQAAQFKARPATVVKLKPFEPKKSDRPLTDITSVELNTERRAKEREEFDMKVKMEQEEVEEMRRKREEEEKQRELEEVARIRKESVHKANPVRRYKQLDIVGSDKPLTDPHSPSFTNRSKRS